MFIINTIKIPVAHEATMLKQYHTAIANSLAKHIGPHDYSADVVTIGFNIAVFGSSVLTVKYTPLSRVSHPHHTTVILSDVNTDEDTCPIIEGIEQLNNCKPILKSGYIIGRQGIKYAYVYDGYLMLVKPPEDEKELS